MLIELSVYALTGLAAGLLAGLLGVGGGLLIVPVLSSAFIVFLDTPYSVHLAIATSLATILITSFASVKAHHAHGAVRWDVLKRMLIGILIGAFIGAWLTQFLSSNILAKLFGVMELLIAMQMLFGRQPNAQRQLPGTFGLSSVGTGVGGLSALLGVGGGMMTTPYFVWHNVSMHQAIATSSAVGLPVALSGTLGYLIAGWSLSDLPDLTWGFVYWPAFLVIISMSVITAKIGANLAHRLSVAPLKKLFALMLIGLGLKMLLL